MLRLYIFKQLPRITLVSSAKLATTASIQCCDRNKVTQNARQLPFKTPTRNIFISSPLEKYNRKSGAKDEETDSEDEADPEFKDERDSKVIKTKVNSLRADLLLKAGLGIARNKIENIFYESRIRVNGKKLAKKSVQLYEGDEIDVIRGFSQQNPSHLVVSRVIILSASEREEGYSVNLRRYKSLLVENYSGVNAFKSSAVADH
ncbi:mitochondrial transcription rescue factor 1 [Lucilia sericata]|uniref:mitochondrial transcription rescue factor 1 n=1 Tax=Lucilia sericata TaxID=13632 RepID=UPI0018A80BF0|nr:mitochondrial transcription rescue factor 1 [Lucilia sericata]